MNARPEQVTLFYWPVSQPKRRWRKTIMKMELAGIFSSLEAAREACEKHCDPWKAIVSKTGGSGETLEEHTATDDNGKVVWLAVVYEVAS